MFIKLISAPKYPSLACWWPSHSVIIWPFLCAHIFLLFLVYLLVLIRSLVPLSTMFLLIVIFNFKESFLPICEVGITSEMLRGTPDSTLRYYTWWYLKNHVRCWRSNPDLGHIQVKCSTLCSISPASIKGLFENLVMLKMMFLIIFERHDLVTEIYVINK